MPLPTNIQGRTWGIVTIVFLLALWFAGSVMLPFIVAGAIAYFLDPVADRLERFGLSRAAATTIMDLGCPLTPWEKTAWRRGGREPYEEGFLQHYVMRSRTASKADSRRQHIMLGLGVVVFNVAVYVVRAMTLGRG